MKFFIQLSFIFLFTLSFNFPDKPSSRVAPRLLPSHPPAMPRIWKPVSCVGLRYGRGDSFGVDTAENGQVYEWRAGLQADRIFFLPLPLLVFLLAAPACGALPSITTGGIAMVSFSVSFQCSFSAVFGCVNADFLWLKQDVPTFFSALRLYNLKSCQTCGSISKRLHHFRKTNTMWLYLKISRMVPEFANLTINFEVKC